jgi:hypothetical protein
MPIYIIESLVGDEMEKRNSFAIEECACELVCSYRGANGKSIYWAFRADHITQLELGARRMGLRPDAIIGVGELDEVTSATNLATRAVPPSGFQIH